MTLTVSSRRPVRGWIDLKYVPKKQGPEKPAKLAGFFLIKVLEFGKYHIISIFLSGVTSVSHGVFPTSPGLANGARKRLIFPVLCQGVRLWADWPVSRGTF